jgi:hypothetical protein
MFKVHLVCEGPTDLEVLQAVLDACLQGIDYLPIVLQPDLSRYGGDAGPLGGGWKGVRRWCEHIAQAGGFEVLQALAPDTDMLIIHVDADIASDREISVMQPCPPPRDTILALERVMLQWLGLQSLPERVAFWIPAMATESWLLRALFPHKAEAAPCEPTALAGVRCVECIADPASALIGERPKLVRRKDGAVKKDRGAYRSQRAPLAARWPELVTELWAAHRLNEAISACVTRYRSAQA